MRNAATDTTWHQRVPGKCRGAVGISPLHSPGHHARRAVRVIKPPALPGVQGIQVAAGKPCSPALPGGIERRVIGQPHLSYPAFGAGGGPSPRFIDWGGFGLGLVLAPPAPRVRVGVGGPYCYPAFTTAGTAPPLPGAPPSLPGACPPAYPAVTAAARRSPSPPCSPKLPGVGAGRAGAEHVMDVA